MVSAIEGTTFAGPSPRSSRADLGLWVPDMRQSNSRIKHSVEVLPNS